jgi:hypothetical protein
MKIARVERDADRRFPQLADVPSPRPALQNAADR